MIAHAHDQSLKDGDSKSALSKNQVMIGHVVISKLLIEGIQIIDNETRNTHRKVKGAIHIKLNESTLNRTGGDEGSSPLICI